MGKSRSIQDQQKKNEEFQKYVQQISKDMEERQNRMSVKLEEMEKQHYEKFSDKALLMEGTYSHLTTMSEWSLNSISAIIDTCSKAIFGEKKDTPAGSDKKDTDKATSASIATIKERELYIANAAFDIVQSIVGGFKDSTSTSVEQKLDGKPIAPGMSLFIGVENNAYSSEKFFTSEKIVQTIFVFKVFYSIKEGQAQSALNDLQMYEDQKEIFRKKIEEFTRLADELDINDDDYDAKFTKLIDRAERLNDRMDAITEKIAKLTADKLAADRAHCNQLVDRMRAGANLLGSEEEVYTVDATEFTCLLNEDSVRDRIRSCLNRGVWLQSLRKTDYVGYHYAVTLGSRSEITQQQADTYIYTALGRSRGFRFD